MPLPGQVREELDEIIVGAFTLADLRRIFLYGLDAKVENYCDVNKPLVDVVLEFMNAIEQRDQLVALLKAMLEARPNNQQLRALCEQHVPLALSRGLPDQFAHAAGDALAAGRAALAGNSQADVQSLVATSRVHAQRLDEDARCLTGYKSLHDNLHHVQMTLQSIIVLQASLNGNPRDWKMLNMLANQMRQFHSSAVLQTRLPIIKQSEESWIVDMDGAIRVLCDAKDAASMVSVRESIEFLNGLQSQSVRMNAIIVMMARRLNIVPLVESLGPFAVPQQPAALGAASTNGFGEVLERLRSVQLLLAGLVQQHDDWQKIEQGFRTGEAWQDPWAKRQAWNWPRLRPLLTDLCELQRMDAWSVEMLGAVETWEREAQAGNAEAAQRAFGTLRSTVSHHFKFVDSELLTLSNSLLLTATALLARLQ